MAKLSKDQLIDAISEMSVLELSELVKALEEKFGVAAIPVAASPVAGSSAGATAAGAEEGGEETKEEQTTFNVVLTGPGANKISVIKALREVVSTLGLKEAKDKVDASEGAPQVILEGVNKATAEEAKKKLEAAGAKVELK